MVRSISLQLKLILFVVLVTIVMTGIMVGFHVNSLEQSVRQTFFGQITGMTTAINGRYEESRSIQDVQQIFDYIQLRNSKVWELTLHGEDGSIKASTDREKITQLSPGFVQATLQTGKTYVEQRGWRNTNPQVRLMAPLIEDGDTVGVIELVLDASNEELLIRKNVNNTLIVATLCGIGAMIVLWFILRKLLVKPLLKMRQAATEIKLGKRARRLELNASQEINEVADAFNDMVVNLDTRYNELQHALLTLQQTQEHLIQAEKMSALGRLVAGIAHEINTPIGVGVTAVSYLEQRIRDFIELYEQNRMKKSDLDRFITSTQETTEMIHLNLRRASELIKSFKQVSVDQSNEEKRKFQLVVYIEDVVRSLQPTVKKSKQRIAVFGDRNLEVNTYPGAVSQIITNLVMNSLIHAYQPDDEGYILIRVQLVENQLVVQYADDGKGMSKEVAEKIFDPFFTTNRGQGGTGLGMNIVFNLVTQKLGGTIQCVSEEGRGTIYILKFLITQEDEHE